MNKFENKTFEKIKENTNYITEISKSYIVILNEIEKIKRIENKLLENEEFIKITEKFNFSENLYESLILKLENINFLIIKQIKKLKSLI